MQRYESLETRATAPCPHPWRGARWPRPVTRQPVPGWLLGLLLGLLLGAGGVTAEERELHQERSLYRNIFVFEKNGVRCMQFRKRSSTGEAQSCLQVDDPLRFHFVYASLMLSSLYLNPEPQRILVLGLGGGTLPTALARVLPESIIDTVEIDPAVSRVAEQFFDFTPGERMRVHEVDGRVFVKRAARDGTRYDLVMLDAFNGDYIPEHLLTREFLEEVKGIIAPGGVLAANTFSESALYDSESVTYAAVFGELLNVRIKDSNRVILWRAGGLPTKAQLQANAERLAPEMTPFGVRGKWVVSQYSRERDWNPGARLLTDQYSPSNLLQGR